MIGLKDTIWPQFLNWNLEAIYMRWDVSPDWDTFYPSYPVLFSLFIHFFVLSQFWIADKHLPWTSLYLIGGKKTGHKINTLIAKYEYSRSKTDNLPLPVQMPLS